METRASYIAVGAFVLALLAGFVAFVIWIGKFEGQRELARYDILFSGSVTGLQTDSTVRYRGIPVGRVIDINIDQQNIEQIRVTIEVYADTPVRVDTVASLELQGITGQSYVLLSGSMQTSEPLPKTMEPPYPIIKSRPSTLERLFEGAPDLIASADHLIDQVTLLFDEKNRKAFGDILQNLSDVTGSFASDTGGFEAVLSNAATAAQNIGDMSLEVRGLATDLRHQLNNKGTPDQATVADVLTSTNTTLAQIDTMSAEFQTLASELRGSLGKLLGKADTTVADLQKTAAEIRGSANAFTSVANNIDSILAENREPLRDFSTNGLYELGQMLTEVRLLVASLTRISAQIERDPARFFFGDRRQGFEAE